MELERGRILFGHRARIACKVERCAHGNDGENGCGERSGQYEKEFAENKIDARQRTGENGLHRAAFFLACGKVDGRINGAGHGKKDDHIAEKAAESGAADFSGGATFSCLTSKGLMMSVGRFRAASRLAMTESR